MLPASKEEDDKPNKRSKIGWWLKWIESAKNCKASERHRKDTQAAYAEYERMSRERGSDTGMTESVMRGYPIYTVSCKTLEAAYYSKSPKTRSKRLHGIEDELALTMTLIADRLGQHIIDYGHFDEGMTGARGDYIHGAKATTQVIYTTKTKPKRCPLQIQEMEGQKPVYYENAPEEAYEGEVMQDAEGYFYEGVEAIEDTQQLILAPALIEEILHTPDAATNAEITEMAYPFCLEYDEAEEKFNPNGDKKLPYSTSRDYKTEKNEDDDEGAEMPGRYLKGYECYCKHTRTVYWVCPEYKTDFLATEKDPWGLRGFFPSPPFILSNKSRKNLYPTPTFVYLEALINQLHTLYYRVFKLVDAVRRRALVYGLSAELIGALNNLEGEDYISIGDIEGILEKGGIERYIQYLPVQELVSALSESLNVENQFKQTFYEWFRLPDVLRGASDPEKTLGANELETDAATDGFKFDKKQIVDLARDSAEMMLDLALKVYSPEKIARICGYEFLEPEHQQRFMPALERLRNDQERIVRIDFETDSTSFRDEAREQQKQQMIAKVVTDGLSMIGKIEHPQFTAVALKMVLGVLESMGGSSQSEDMIKGAVKDLEEAKNAPPPPPPPDYEGMKVQILGQKNEIQANKDQMAAMAKARELDQKEYKLGIEERQAQFDQQLQVAEHQLDQTKQAFTEQIETIKQQSDEAIRAYQAKLDQALVAVEQQRVMIEAFQAKAQAQESALEEVRLAKEASVEAINRVTEFIATQAETKQEDQPKVEKAPSQPLNITIVNAGKKRHSFHRDADGNLIGADSEEIQ